MAFGKPENWRVDSKGAKTLNMEYAYMARVRINNNGRSSSGEIGFSISDLQNIPRGNLLAGVDDDKQVMKYREFRDNARANCSE